jgi:hypothetical protein
MVHVPPVVTHAPPEQTWPAGHVTVGLLQPCVSVEVELTPHVPPEHEYVVTERDCVPDPPHASAEQALQAP